MDVIQVLQFSCNLQSFQIIAFQVTVAKPIAQATFEKQGYKSQYLLFLFCFRVCWIHHVTGVWVYPLLEHLSPGVKIIFFAAVTIIINIFYLVGEVLNNYIWDTQKCEYCFRNINWWNTPSGLEYAPLKVEKILSWLKQRRVTEAHWNVLLACSLKQPDERNGCWRAWWAMNMYSFL